MFVRKHALIILIVLSPGAIGAFSGQAVADVASVLRCRQLPPGPGRADCLERATADLDRQSGGEGQATRNGRETARTAVKSRFTAGVEAITYQDGRPIFQLDNGQRWYSMDRRRLTFKRGHSYATIEKTPVGMLLHYNGSFFALQVVPKQG